MDVASQNEEKLQGRYSFTMRAKLPRDEADWPYGINMYVARKDREKPAPTCKIGGVEFPLSELAILKKRREKLVARQVSCNA